MGPDFLWPILSMWIIKNKIKFLIYPLGHPRDSIYIQIIAISEKSVSFLKGYNCHLYQKSNSGTLLWWMLKVPNTKDKT
jgi:hypothetical protein